MGMWNPMLMGQGFMPSVPHMTWDKDDSGNDDMQMLQIHCKYMGGWFVFKSIAHWSKCPIELSLCIDFGQKC